MRNIKEVTDAADVIVNGYEMGTEKWQQFL